jgi:hypothetical protein
MLLIGSGIASCLFEYHVYCNEDGINYNRIIPDGFIFTFVDVCPQSRKGVVLVGCSGMSVLLFRSDGLLWHGVPGGDGFRRCGTYHEVEETDWRNYCDRNLSIRRSSGASVTGPNDIVGRRDSRRPASPRSRGRHRCALIVTGTGTPDAGRRPTVGRRLTRNFYQNARSTLNE